jgi:hypothetical protein
MIALANRIAEAADEHGIVSAESMVRLAPGQPDLHHDQRADTAMQALGIHERVIELVWD